MIYRDDDVGRLKVVFMQRAKTPKGDRKLKGQRYTVTLRGVYSDTLNELIEDGVYMDHQDCIRASLRLLFKEQHGIRLYNRKLETSP